jgi:hypothetical protein
MKTSAKTPRRAPTRPRPAAGPAAPIEPLFAPVVAAFAKNREVGVGRRFSSHSVLNVGGKIFAMFVKGQFVAKLPKDRVADLVSSGVGEHFDPGHGRLMKEWVALADARASWVALAREALAFVKAGRR